MLSACATCGRVIAASEMRCGHLGDERVWCEDCGWPAKIAPNNYRQAAGQALPEAEIHITDETALGNLTEQGRKTTSAIVVVNGEPVGRLPFTAAGYEVGINGLSKIRLEILSGGAAFDTRKPRA